MAYAIRFKSRAREELDECCQCYGDTLRSELNGWLLRLAGNAGSSVAGDSINISEIIEEAAANRGASWERSWRKWWKAPLLEKARAIHIVFKKWCPPWQLMFAIRWFNVIGRFDCEVHAYFIVDHVEKQIIFVKFDGLPGQ